MKRRLQQVICPQIRLAQELMRPEIQLQRQLRSMLAPPDFSKRVDEIFQAQESHERERRAIESLSSEALAKMRHCAPSTLTRKASAVWKQEGGPAPLPGIPEWWVVEAPNAEGGRGCGWRFARAQEARSLW